MVTIFDVAKYILEKCGHISTWKLQKLCYYAQAWALAWSDNQPIFNEDFQAWKNGPVCPELFYAHQGLYTISAKDLKQGCAENLSQEDVENIDIVLDHYGHMEPWELRELSHSEDPWKDARNGLPEDASSHNIITKEAMGNYYGSQ